MYGRYYKSQKGIFMKKILLALGLLIGCACYAADCDEICVEPYNLSHGASRFMSAVTGSNLTAEKIAQILIKKSIVKQANGKFKVSVDSYSVKDLKKGIFKSFSLTGKNVDLGDVYFSEFNLKTLCRFNYIEMTSDKKPVFREDLPLSFSVVMTSDDINNTMNGESYRRVVESINSFGSGFFRVNEGKVKINNNHFFYILKVSIPFVRNLQNIVISSDLNVSNGKIDFKNTKLVGDSFMFDLKKIDKLINYLNPLDYSLEVLENNNAEMNVRNIKIKNDKVYANGIVVIPKSKG